MNPTSVERPESMMYQQIEVSGGLAPPVDARSARILADDIRPEDYLTTPPEVREIVDRELERLRKVNQIEVDPSTRLRMLIDATLQHHFAAREVACKRTDQGVIVLAVGPDEVTTLVRAVPPDQRRGVVIEYP